MARIRLRLATAALCFISVASVSHVPANARAQQLRPASAARTSNDDAERERRLKWFREARFGLFIHWGVYAVPAGEWKGKLVPGIGEWIMNRAKIPVREYEQLAPQFNPVKFDADEWVRMAKDAGMKYIVITAKHHDGFAMYHSKASSFNIVDATPFKRDPLKELAAAAQKPRPQALLLLLADAGLARAGRRGQRLGLARRVEEELRALPRREGQAAGAASS